MIAISVSTGADAWGAGASWGSMRAFIRSVSFFTVLTVTLVDVTIETGNE